MKIDISQKKTKNQFLKIATIQRKISAMKLLRKYIHILKVYKLICT